MVDAFDYIHQRINRSTKDQMEVSLTIAKALIAVALGQIAILALLLVHHL